MMRIDQHGQRAYWIGVGIEAARDDRTRSSPTRFARGSGLIRLPRCSACGTPERLHAHPRMENVLICGDCYDREREPVDYFELGWGD